MAENANKRESKNTHDAKIAIFDTRVEIKVTVFDARNVRQLPDVL